MSEEEKYLADNLTLGEKTDLHRVTWWQPMAKSEHDVLILPISTPVIF